MLSGVFMPSSILTVLISTGFIFFMTCAGSAVVLFFKKDLPDWLQRLFLGLAAGIMIASSIWSLLLPAIEQSKGRSLPDWLPASLGFLLGSFCLLFLERFLSQMIKKRFKKIPNFLLFLAITLHNIPEGMAVGLAWPLALGIGIQNFPEGTAISLPLRQSGFSRKKAFFIGCATGIVEPIFGILAFLLSKYASILMPWLLSFAAGAMIYVVAEELIPEAHLGEQSMAGTIGVIIGFLLMMILDVSLS